MDIVLEGPICSLSQNDATIDLNENLNLLLMAMESYKVFSVLLGGEDETEDEFYSIFGATESYEDDDFDGYDSAMESADDKLDEFTRKLLREMSDDYGKIFNEGYKTYNEDLKRFTKDRFVDYFIDNVVKKDEDWLHEYSNPNFKKALHDQLHNTYELMKKKIKGDDKPSDNTKQLIKTDNKVGVAGSGKSVEDKAEKKFGEIIKEFFKKIGEWFKRIFGNEKGEVENKEVIFVSNINPNIINQKGLDLVEEILNCKDEKVAREKLELLQSLVNSTRETVEDELIKVKSNDKYVGKKIFFHAKTFFSKAHKLANAEYQHGILQNEVLNEYQKLINIIADAIVEEKDFGKKSVKHNLKSTKSQIEKKINKVAKANNKVNKISQKS